jgi:hypothetical protein
MSHRIVCYTLFDITKTGVLNRARPSSDVTDNNEWFRKRNTQCNFDTILQVISLRAQPDVTKDPQLKLMNLDKEEYFGYVFKAKDIPVWTFDFEIQHSSVFEDGIEELGALYKDCEGVPMIRCDTQWINAGDKLDITSETRNIYFAKY